VRPCVPTKIEKLKDPTDDQPGLYKVTGKMNDGTEVTEEYNTVLFAVGRAPCTHGIGLEEVGVKLNPKNGKVIVKNEQTSVPNIYAIGDIIEGGLELTPVAIKAGQYLADRLFNKGSKVMEYRNVPTTVFTPIEYGACGYTEEAATKDFGEDKIEVYHSYFLPFEWNSPYREERRPSNTCYVKVICQIVEGVERMIGIHYLGPNAGEVIQLGAPLIKIGAPKTLLDDTVGIHPTSAEIFTMLHITKRSGKDPALKGCCG